MNQFWRDIWTGAQYSAILADAIPEQKALNTATILTCDYVCIAEEVSTLFRGTSLTTTLMDQYMKMVAIPFVQRTIGDVVAKILDCRQSCEVCSSISDLLVQLLNNYPPNSSGISPDIEPTRTLAESAR